MPHLSRRLWISYLVAAVALLVALFFWQRGYYLGYGEGVYLFSARLIDDGAVPYRDFLAAHPPLLFYTGAGMLSISDSLDGLRALLSLVSLATGALVALAVVRLTGNAPAGVVGGLLVIVAPWTLHDHAVLDPETFAAPLLLAAAILASRRRSAVLGGLVAAAAVGYKWPYLLPGLTLAFVAPARVRYLAALAIGFASGVLISFALFGADNLYQQLVVAQQDVGWHSLEEFGGLAVQAAWNLAGLVVLAAIGVLYGARAQASSLFSALVTLAATNLLLVATMTKTGTYLNTLVPVEPPLIALGVAGTVWALREKSRLVPALASAVVFTSAQVIAFVARPSHPAIFVRPFSRPAHAWTAKDQVAAAVRVARACPPGVPYSGTPFIAFVARRPMPADEPDQFLMATPVGARAARQAAAVRTRCPA